MIDLLTVAFSDELPILKVQAQSIDLYGRGLNVNNIYVIVNDSDDVVNLIDATWWGSLASKVKIIPRSVFSIDWLHSDGWVSQQIFKILGAALSYNSWTLVLDAKTILIQPITQVDLVKSTDISNQSTCNILPAWNGSKFHHAINELFNIDLNSAVAPNGVPFLFHNNTIRSMIGDITKQTNEGFTHWFQRQYSPSEFLLYAGYLKYLHGSVDKMFSIHDKKYNVLNICHSEHSSYDILVNQMINRNDLLTVSIHRGTWNKLSADQKQTYTKFLISKNITTAKELL